MPEHERGQGASGAREWLRTLPVHPALAAAALACVVTIIGVVIVDRPTTPSGTLQAWGGSLPINAEPAEQEGVPLAPSASTTPSLGSSAAPIYLPPAQQFTENGGDPLVDLAALLAQLSPSTGANAPTSDSDVSEAYSFIPQGLISTEATQPHQRTELQDALFEYGNAAGGYIQTYEDTHHGVVQTLTDVLADRYNEAKVQAALAIGDALISVGKNLEEVEAPSVARSVNVALARAYEDIGAKLKIVVEAKRDEELVAAVQSYDDAADQFTKRYVAVAELLSGAGVVFDSTDSGSVFTFTTAAGL